jgi:hypothetical protein
VPLAGDDPDVHLPLQPAFDRMYDEGGYARLLDYRQDPPEWLPAADREWGLSLLREAGVREAGAPD